MINDFDIRGKYLIKVTVIKQLTEKQPIKMLQSGKMKKERIPMKEHCCEINIKKGRSLEYNCFRFLPYYS